MKESGTSRVQDNIGNKKKKKKDDLP